VPSSGQQATLKKCCATTFRTNRTLSFIRIISSHNKLVRTHKFNFLVFTPRRWLHKQLLLSHDRSKVTILHLLPFELWLDQATMYCWPFPFPMYFCVCVVSIQEGTIAYWELFQVTSSTGVALGSLPIRLDFFNKFRPCIRTCVTGFSTPEIRQTAPFPSPSRSTLVWKTINHSCGKWMRMMKMRML